MPKQIPATELDAVVQVVGQFPNGAAVSEVRGALDIELSRRTLQRRLARLVEAGRLETFGEGRRPTLSCQSATGGGHPAGH